MRELSKANSCTLKVDRGKVRPSSPTTSRLEEQSHPVAPYTHVFHLFLALRERLVDRYLVNKVRHEFRQIFFEMGFEEMPTNRY